MGRLRSANFILAICFLLPGQAVGQAQDNSDLPQNQQQAIAAIERVGGYVSRDNKLPGRPVTRVYFYRITDDALELVQAFPSLKSLSVWHGNITEAGLAHIGRMVQLEHLHFEQSPVSDAGFAHLGQLTQLQSLEILEASFTDAGLAHLRHCTKLTHLRLSKTPITDAGVIHLQGLSKLKTLDLRDTSVTEIGASALKEALPYTMIRFGPIREGAGLLGPGFYLFLLTAGVIAVLAGGVAYCLSKWRRTQSYRWLWKLPIVAASILIIGIAVRQLMPFMNPLKDGDAATFWLRACHVDVGVKDPYLGFDGFYLPRDGWYISYEQGFHQQFLYRVRSEEAEALFPKVVEKLRKAPPGVLLPDVEQGFKSWQRSNPHPNDAAGLLTAIRDAELTRLQKESPGSFEYARMREQAFGERWQRIQRFKWNARFEFLFFEALVLFIAWPWLRGAGHIQWAIHLALLPILLFLPFWLGYSQLTFTSLGPSGGVLYPIVIHFFRGFPWTPLDSTIAGHLPHPLQSFSQTPGPMLSLSGMGAPGFVAISVLGLAIAIGVMIIGALAGRRKRP